MSKKSGRVFVVGNLKGGTGKSTLAVNFACEIADRGSKTVLIDTDPQRTSSEWLSNCKSSTVEYIDCELSIVSDAIEFLKLVNDLRTRFDRIVIDLPAVVGPALGSALLLADTVLVPTSSTPVDVAATKKVLDKISRATKERRNDAAKVVIVPIRSDANDPSLVRLGRNFGAVLSPRLPSSEDFTEGFDKGGWVGSSNRSSFAHNCLKQIVDFAENTETDKKASAVSEQRAHSDRETNLQIATEYDKFDLEQYYWRRRVVRRQATMIAFFVLLATLVVFWLPMLANGMISDVRATLIIGLISVAFVAVALLVVRQVVNITFHAWRMLAERRM